MGHGAPRELGSTTKTDRTLDPEVSKKLGAALERYDEVDEEFRQAREDERRSQLSKMWTTKAGGMVEQLRELTLVFIREHQVSLDCGSDGGGIGATPWIEETGLKFDRLEFSFRDDEVVAETGNEELASTTVEGATIDWMEECIVKWLIYQVESRA